MCFVHHVNVEKQAMTLLSVIACTFLYYFMICTLIMPLLGDFTQNTQNTHYSKYSKQVHKLAAPLFIELTFFRGVRNKETVQKQTAIGILVIDVLTAV